MAGAPTARGAELRRRPGKLPSQAPEFGAGFTGWNRLPDLTTSWRMERDWDHVKAGGVLR